MRDLIKQRLRVLTEDTHTVNRILDKITASGFNSLSPAEKNYLNKQSAGEDDPEAEELMGIEKGYTFNKELADGNELNFEYDSTTVDDKITHRGIFWITGGHKYICEIHYFAKPEIEFIQYSLFDPATEKYFPVNSPEADRNLNQFFEEIGDKINLLGKIRDKIFKKN